MRERIVQLTATDFQEALDLINYAFSYSEEPHDFLSLLPKVYKPTDQHMGYNHAIRRDGRLVAIAAVFPLTWHVGGTELRVAGISGVSTHPKYRGQGLMIALMRHCLDKIHAADYSLSWLMGLRSRYRHFGYEQCGTELLFTLNQKDLQAAGVDGTRVDFRPLDHKDPLLTDAQQLHARQNMYCERPPTEFVDICCSWNNRPYAAVIDHALAGYLISGSNGSQVTELIASNTQDTLRIASAWCAYRNIPATTIAVSPADLDLARILHAIAESTAIHPANNWQVFDWPATLCALLKQRVRAGGTESGSLVLQIGDKDRLCLHVDGTRTEVAPTDEPAQITMDEITAMRSLFGLLRPPLPFSWFPLPAHLSHADRV